MKCKECKFCKFAEDKGGCNRYYCTHPTACEKNLCSAVLLCRTDRHDDKLKIKTAPRWCPLKESI